MLSDNEIGSIVKSELESALAYEGELAKKREKLLDYYNGQPYGDEVDGQSSVVTSEVADTVEWMLPSLLRVFTQGKTVATFEGNTGESEEEAEQKTALSNYVFLQENDGVLVLHNALKDCLLQYTGTVKVYWDEEEIASKSKYRGLDELEYQALLARDGVTVDEVAQTEDGFYNVDTSEVTIERGVRYANIPPEEFLISKTARDFDCPSFIGHRSPKTRSQLVEMGFKRDIVDSLPADEYYEYNGQKSARYHDYDNWQDSNTSNHSPNDIVYLGEYYCRIDVNEDGITELWQVFYAGDEVLSKEQVDDHPFAVLVPIPIPHRAIGTCPAEQVADIQFRKSTLVRQMLNNIYQSNFPRILHSNQVELDDLLVPRAGGLVGIDTDAPDVAGHAQMLQVVPQIDGILKALEYTDMEKEVRTGVTRYGQGLDAESLNKTATGFLGIKDASQQRIDLIARIVSVGIKDIFEKTIALLAKYQDTPKQIQVLGEPLEINPTKWGNNCSCRIDVGVGSGDRQEKIANLNAILGKQMEMAQLGYVISDQAKMYNTLDKLITEVGLKDVDRYFNNPDIPEETLFAQNTQLAQMVQQMQQELQTAGNMAAAEAAKAQATIESAKMKTALEADKDQRAHAVKMRELELKAIELNLKEKEIQVDTLQTLAEVRKTQSETRAQNLETEAVESGLNEILEQINAQ